MLKPCWVCISFSKTTKRTLKAAASTAELRYIPQFSLLLTPTWENLHINNHQELFSLDSLLGKYISTSNSRQTAKHVTMEPKSFWNRNHDCHTFLPDFFSIKVEKILKGSLESIPSPSPSVKIQIMGEKVCLRCKGKTLLGIVNKLLKTKSLLTSPSNVLPYYLK